MRKANQKSRNDGVGEWLYSAELRFIMCMNGNLVEMHPCCKPVRDIPRHKGTRKESTREVKGGSYRIIDIVRVTAGTIQYCKVPTAACGQSTCKVTKTYAWSTPKRKG